MKTSHPSSQQLPNLPQSAPLPESSTEILNFNVELDSGLPPTIQRQKIEAAKRLDWRFFLPCPELTHVGYWGPKECELAKALSLFCPDLTFLAGKSDLPTENTRKREQPTTYPLIVLKDPLPEVLRWAPTVLQPGGALYLEAYGALWPQRWFQRKSIPQLVHRSRLLHLKDYVRALQGMGFSQVEALWMWPSFDNTRKIMPLEAHAALSYVTAVKREESRSLVQLLKQFERQRFWESQWFGFFVPCFSIIACAPVH